MLWQVSEAQAEEATLRRQVAALEASQLAAQSAQREGEAVAAADADRRVWDALPPINFPFSPN